MTDILWILSFLLFTLLRIAGTSLKAFLRAYGSALPYHHSLLKPTTSAGPTPHRIALALGIVMPGLAFSY